MQTAKVKTLNRISGLIIVCSASSFFASQTLYAQTCENWVAKAVSVQGAVEKNDGGQEWQTIHFDDTICPGEKVRVGENSRAALHLSNNTYLRLGEKSLMSFPRQATETSYWVELTEGVGHFISRIVNHFEVATPYVNAAVEGTEFVVKAKAPNAAVTVIEGKVLASNKVTTEHLTAGEQANSAGAQTPLSRINVNSQNIVEWAIYYPPVLTFDSLHPGNATDEKILNEVTLLTNAGRPDLALQQLPKNGALSTELSIARASVLLAVGRVADAESELTQNMDVKKAPAANAMLAVSHAARNDAQNALAYGEKAVQAGPTLALTYIAQSYAQQANLQPELALTSAQKATEVEPNNAVAWQRLAELKLIHGNISGADSAISKAQKLAPENTDVLTGAGFVALFDLHLKHAESLFRQALKLGSTNPQTRLGLGLTLLRGGDLKAGREQIEYAASLDPTRSVIRSYLGRAYFAEKRDDKASTQWQLAKQFDPNDPTPYFYQGIEKLFANDPSGAITEIEKSQELNDKRNVYRSETLLQSDSATKSAALARAYSEIGDDQAVLIKGTEAIQQDPTNAEGHRLLADRYATLPRHDAARVSELLQSQLWGALSAYPLQPQLSETNLAITEGLGPERPGLNEYHSLFTQNGEYALLNGFGGSDNTWGDDAVASMLEGPITLSLGQYKYETEGFRKNSDQNQEIYNAFAQWQVTPKTSLQMEAKHFDFDRNICIFNCVVSNSTSANKTNTYRVGLNQKLSSNQFILLSATSQNRDTEQTHLYSGVAKLNGEDITRSQSIELQHVIIMSDIKLISGAGEVKTPDKIITQPSIIIPDIGEIAMDPTEEKLDSSWKNAYLYAIANIGEQVIIEPAISYASWDVQSNADSAWSPKLGLLLQPSKEVRLQLATFKYVQRSLINQQTIEPTNLLGASQFTNELDGTNSTNHLANIDINFKNIRTGLNLSNKNARVPVYQTDTNTTESLPYKEKVLQYYLDFMPSNNLFINIGLTSETYDFKYKQSQADNLLYSKTIQLPLKLTKLFTSQWSINLQSTHAQQRNTIATLNESSDTVESKSNHSATFTDISTTFRLPHRKGEIGLGVNNISNNKTEIINGNQDYFRFYPNRFIYSRIQLNF